MFSQKKDLECLTANIAKKLKISVDRLKLEQKNAAYSIKQFSKEYSKNTSEYFELNNSLDKTFLPVSYVWKNTCSILTLKDISEQKPNGILFYDIDETLIDYAKSIKLGELQIINQDILMKELALARENNFLIGLLTSRTYNSKEYFAAIVNVRNIIITIGKNFFDFVIYTNNDCLKCRPMKVFQQEFELPSKKLCLVDDMRFNIDPCYKFGFVGIDSGDEMRFQQILNFLSLIPPEQKNDISKVTAMSLS